MSESQPPLDGNLCLDFIYSDDTFAAIANATPSARARAAVQRFRATLARLVDAEAKGAGADPADLAALNGVLARGGARRGLVPTVRGYGWGWLDDDGGMDHLLWPVAFSAARLLAGDDLARVKRCDGCGRLFLDASKNRSRRWCDMLSCGNRAKQRRFRGRNGL